MFTPVLEDVLPALMFLKILTSTVSVSSEIRFQWFLLQWSGLNG